MTAFAPRPTAFEDRHGHAAVLEGTGGIQPFVFDEEFKTAAQAFHQAGHGDQGSIAFKQRNYACVGWEVQEWSIVVNNTLPVMIKFSHGLSYAIM